MKISVLHSICSKIWKESVAIPPKYSISNFMGYLKGRSTLMIYDRDLELQSKWGNIKPPVERMVGEFVKKVRT